jgi:manganese transport protein
LLAFVFALVQFGPDWGQLVHQVTHPVVAADESVFTYAYFGIALFGAAMTPYEVFFFSSGAVEEGWTREDLGLNRANVYVGFPLGGILSLSIMALAALVLAPMHIGVDTLPQVALPVATVSGKLALACAILGIFAATFGAALETGLSAGYCIAQYFGWQWGKHVRPREAARFHVVVVLSILFGVLLIMTGVDPVKVTEYSIVLSAAALPFTYFPILVVSNDPDYMGDHTNGPVLNIIALIYLCLIVVIALATIPLMIITKAGA